jgi:hypothetical protein
MMADAGPATTPVVTAGARSVRRVPARRGPGRRVRRIAVSVVHVALVLALLADLAIVPGPVLPPQRKMCASDVLQAKAVAGLGNFASWLRRNQVSGFVGEVGWPSTRDSARWNALADTWYRAADDIGLPVTAWAAGPWPADYPMSIYRPDPGSAGAQTPGPQASVVERHPSTGRYLRGVALAGGSFAAGDTDAAFSTANPGRYGQDYRYDSAATFRGLSGRGVRLVRLAVIWERLQPMPFGPLSGQELARVRAALD